ncbi:MAG: hypothetical protein RL459_2104 [Pseudomonadota bacterium]|jgi:FlaA1/EpsC-like NDP-sugar epimerase
MMNRMAKVVLDLPRAAKRLLVLVLDGSLCALALWMAMALRLERMDVGREPYLWALLLSLTLALPIFIRHGLYRAIFRFSGWNALAAVLRALGLYGLMFAVALLFLALPGVPRSMGVIQPLILLIFVGMSRAFARYWLGGGYQQALRRKSARGVLVFGAGSAGRQLAAAMRNAAEHRLLGFLDDDPNLHDHAINGWTVYNPKDIARLISDLRVTDVLLAAPSMSRQRRKDLLEVLSRYPVHVRTLPSLMDLTDGKVQISDLKELEIEDLLGREPVLPDQTMMGRHVTGQVVMVTGAGGSIGSELCRQIVTCAPQTLLLVEMTEFALYAIQQDLEKLMLGNGMRRVDLVPLLASVCDSRRMHEIISTWRPHALYHAAAYKHVPLVEHNPAEGVKNNVLGTLTTAKVAAANGVREFVLVSTDKAVRPTNIMGASKRLAEMVLQAMHHSAVHQGWQTRFSMVRFGNVLGSSGSVVPLFRKQIKDGGPITLTHEDITRYFMTIPEAAQLVIQAGAMAQGGDVFVLDMGEPVKIIDLARRMVELSGLSIRDTDHPQGDIEIAITGLRPGEKLYEELLIGDNPLPTEHLRIMKSHEDFFQLEELQQRLDALSGAVSTNDVPQIRTLLKELVPGYRPDGEVVDWVYQKQLAQS